jgi:hypothetical protein
MRSRVSPDIRPRSLSALDAVEIETPAAAATSFIVTREEASCTSANASTPAPTPLSTIEKPNEKTFSHNKENVFSVK